MRTTHMVTRAARSAWACVLALGACASMSDSAENPSFDRWCDGVPCGWTEDQGNVERTGTWHAKDYGVSFLEVGTQLSQAQSIARVSCLRFDMIADVVAEARVVLRLDFDDDGTADVEQAVPAVRWKNVPFVIPVPTGTSSVRYMLQKQGEGRAVLAQLVIRTGDCTTNTEGSDKSE